MHHHHRPVLSDLAVIAEIKEANSTLGKQKIRLCLSTAVLAADSWYVNGFIESNSGLSLALLYSRLNSTLRSSITLPDAWAFANPSSQCALKSPVPHLHLPIYDTSDPPVFHPRPQNESAASLILDLPSPHHLSSGTSAVTIDNRPSTAPGDGFSTSTNELKPSEQGFNRFLDPTSS